MTRIRLLIPSLALMLVGVLMLAGCSAAQQAQTQASAPPQQVYKWKMVTSWPDNFPGLGTGATNLAALIEEMSGGRIEVTVYAAGELVGALETFDAVSRGTAEMGHSGAFYWAGKSPASQLFTGIPFGLNAQEKNAWLYHGGGLELWQKVYAKFNLVPFPSGNLGIQMGGWFNKEINSLEDLKGLKMRIPGIGGAVLERAGGVAVTLAGGDLFTTLQTGVVDATEWVGPYNDLAFGLHRAARYYYYPGWHEPGATIEFTVNKDAYDALPPDLQSIIKNAARVINEDMQSDFIANNNLALTTLVEQHGVEIRRFSQEIVNQFAVLTEEVLEEIAAEDAEFREVYYSMKAFRDDIVNWHEISESAYMQMRKTALEALE